MIRGVPALLLIGALAPACEGDVPRDDGAVQVPIDREGSLQNAAWSPDGDALLFTVFQRRYNAGAADLAIADVATGADRTLVADGSGNVNLPGSSWNAATHTIVFSSTREPHDEIFAIEEDGSTGDERAITGRPSEVAYEPTLSPDGAWVVFESHPLDVEGEGVVTKYALDGSSDYVALTDPADDCRQPNWSPAGDRILYQRLADGQWDLWVMASDGSDARQVTSGPGDKTDASFSPDGAWIVYSSEQGDLDLANLFAVAIDGGSPVRVTHWDGYDGAPSWSPDGATIAFESTPGDPDRSDGTTLWTVDAPDRSR